MSPIIFKKITWNYRYKRMSNEELIADVCNIFHWGIISFVLFAPFSSEQRILFIVLMLMYTIVVHWIANNNVCCLTVIEKILRKEPDDSKTFFGRLIGPIYTFGNEDYICHTLMFTLMMITLYRLDIRELKFREFIRIASGK